MTDAGELRHVLTVYTSTEQDNECGETDFVFAPQKTVRAKIVPTSGGTAQLPGDMERVEVTHKITVRERSLPHPTTDMYFVCRGQRYDVQSWQPIYNQRGWTEFLCKLVIENGA